MADGDVNENDSSWDRCLVFAMAGVGGREGKRSVLSGEKSQRKVERKVFKEKTQGKTRG